MKAQEQLAEFEREWKAGEWSSCGAFCLPFDQVEVLETVQEEEVTAPGQALDRGSCTTEAGSCACLWIRTSTATRRQSTRTGHQSAARAATVSAGNRQRQTDSRRRSLSALCARTARSGRDC